MVKDQWKWTVLDLSKNLDDLSWEKHRVLGSMTKLQFLEDSKEKVNKKLLKNLYTSWGSSDFSIDQVRKNVPCHWHQMQAVSWAGNKGQIKPEFLVLNFTFHNGISVHHPFNLSGGQKIPLEILINPTGICTYIYAYTSCLCVIISCMMVWYSRSGFCLLSCGQVFITV